MTPADNIARLCRPTVRSLPEHDRTPIRPMHSADRTLGRVGWAVIALTVLFFAGQFVRLWVAA